MPRAIDNSRREPGGKHWGPYTSTSTLPGASSGLALYDLTVGDLASVDGEVYICTATGSTATWKKIVRDGGTIASATFSDDVVITDTLTVNGVAALNDDLTVLGSAVLSDFLTVAGTSTLTGGIIATTLGQVTNIPIGNTAYGSLGTDTLAGGTGTTYFSELWLPANKSCVGAAILNGTTAGTDKWILALANSTGTIVATTALAGTTASGTDAFQEIAFTAPYAAVGPARYWLVAQVNGNTTKLRTIAASTFRNWANSAAGTFGTLESITPATSTNAGKGPIGYVYT